MWAHHPLTPRQGHQRVEGKRQGNAEHHLSVNDQLLKLFLIEVDQKADDQDWDQSNRPGQQAPLPEGQANVDEPLHHDLASQGTGDGGDQARQQEGEGKEPAHQWACQVADNLRVLKAVKDIFQAAQTGRMEEERAAQDQQEGVHNQGRKEVDQRVPISKAQRLPNLTRIVFIVTPALGEGRM